MNNPIIDEGIILSFVPYGETSKIATVLTKEHGKIGVIVRGVRNPKNKLAAFVDLFTQGEFSLIKGKGSLYTLFDINPLFLPSNPSFFALAGGTLLLEIVNILLSEEEQLSLSSYNAFIHSIRECFSSEYAPEKNLFFVQSFLKEEGFQVNLNICSICQQKVLDDCFYYPQDGRITHMSCHNKNHSVNTPIQRYSFLMKESLFLLQAIDHNDLDKVIAMTKIRLPWKNINAFVEEELQYSLGFIPKSWSIYKNAFTYSNEQ